MTRLPAKVLSNEKRGEQYCVTVEIEVANFRRSFNSLRFGDQIPFSGSCRDGTLLLRYYQDPGVKVGQPFPLWLIEFGNRESRSIGDSRNNFSFPPLKLSAGPFTAREFVSWPLSHRFRE
jgi:hypothetical protein